MEATTSSLSLMGSDTDTDQCDTELLPECVEDDDDEDALLFDLIAQVNTAAEQKQLQIWKCGFASRALSTSNSGLISLEQTSCRTPTLEDCSPPISSVKRSLATRFVRQMLENEETYGAIVQANKQSIRPLFEFAMSCNECHDVLSEDERKLMNDLLRIQRIRDLRLITNLVQD